MASPAPANESLSTRFCDPNADVTLRSCDGMLFKFYRKQLEAHSVAFAGGEAFLSVAEETIDLTETSEVVDLLLQLMSLKKQPNLMTLGLEFSVLAQLADAIEKYEVVSAMNICDMAMRAAIPKGHAVEVLEWAARGGYADTMDEAAPATIGYKLDKLKSLRSVPVHVAWVRSNFVRMKDTAIEEFGKQLQYFQHWLDTLNDAHRMMQNPPKTASCRGGSGCTNCEAAARAIIYRLAARPGVLLDLDKVFRVDVPQVDKPLGVPGPQADRLSFGGHRDSGPGHIDMTHARRAVTDMIVAIPKFSSLL